MVKLCAVVIRHCHYNIAVFVYLFLCRLFCSLRCHCVHLLRWAQHLHPRFFVSSNSLHVLPRCLCPVCFLLAKLTIDSGRLPESRSALPSPKRRRRRRRRACAKPRRSGRRASSMRQPGRRRSHGFKRSSRPRRTTGRRTSKLPCSDRNWSTKRRPRGSRRRPCRRRQIPRGRTTVIS